MADEDSDGGGSPDDDDDIADDDDTSDDDDDDTGDDDDDIPETEIRCGHEKDGTNAGGANDFLAYNIAGGTYDGPEIYYHFNLDHAAVATFDVDASKDDLHLFVLDQYKDPTQTLATGNESLTVELVAGEYYVGIDGKDGETGDFTISSSCRSPEFEGAKYAYGQDGAVTLGWDPPDWAKGSLSYNIYWAETWGGQDFSSPDDTDSEPPYLASGLTNGNLYCFAVGFETENDNIFISENQACARPAPVFKVGDGADYDTITQAISAAQASADGGNILVQGGVFTQVLTIDTTKGIGLYGGFSDSWVRDPFHNETSLVVAGNAITASGGTVFIDGFTMEGGQTAVSFDEGSLYLSNNTFTDQDKSLDTAGSAMALKNLFVYGNQSTNTAKSAFDLADLGEVTIRIERNTFSMETFNDSVAAMALDALLTGSSLDIGIQGNEIERYGQGIAADITYATGTKDSASISLDSNRIDSATTGIEIVLTAQNSSSATLSSVSILRNLVANCDTGIVVEHGTAANSATLTFHPVFANNAFACNETGAIVTSFDADHSFNGAAFANNVFARNAYDGFSYDGEGTLAVTNSIFWENLGDDLSGVGDLEVNYSIVGDGAAGTGNKTDEPLFSFTDSCGIDNLDFHLDDSSPAIDQGSPADSDLDLDGSRNDMGIYGGPYRVF